jgi:zinc transporter ZupT
VPITAGGFVYLAGSDLLPELQHEAGGVRTTLRQILMIAAGVALMAALTVVE